MLVLTTSMPTPRPDTSVTCRAVEKPGSRIKSSSSRGDIRSSSGSVLSRMASALARTAWGSMPRPSSRISMRTWPSSCAAVSVIWPDGGLPLATRSSGVSMPWSTLLRTRWVSGSESCSRIVLSSSTSRPTIVTSTCLPSCRPEVANHPRKFPEQIADRLHPRPQDRLLECGRDRAQAAARWAAAGCLPRSKASSD